MWNGRAYKPGVAVSHTERCHRGLTPLCSRYEMRRQCQEILPRLYLGPLQASKSLETLQSLGITHMYVRHAALLCTKAF